MLQCRFSTEISHNNYKEQESGATALPSSGRAVTSNNRLQRHVALIHQRLLVARSGTTSVLQRQLIITVDFTAFVIKLSRLFSASSWQLTQRQLARVDKIVSRYWGFGGGCFKLSQLRHAAATAVGAAAHFEDDLHVVVPAITMQSSEMS